MTLPSIGWIAAALSGGVVLGSWGAGPAGALFVASLGSLLALWGRVAGRPRYTLVLTVVVSLTAAAGLLRTADVLARYEAGVELLAPAVGQSVTLTGIVDAPPDVREGRTLYTLLVATGTAPTRVMVYAPPHPALTFGERVSVAGDLQELTPFASEQGRVFNYPRFRAVSGIQYDLFADEVVALGRAEDFAPVRSRLFRVKDALLARLNALLPEPASALAAGILLGEKRALGEELVERFRATGVVHIVVLSGYNVTVIAEGVRLLLRFLPLAAQVVVSSITMVLFAIMVGGGATIVRATLMGLMGMLARATGSVYLITRALLLAGVVMVWWNPLILLYDPSFQLSFAATLGLIHLTPLVERLLPVPPLGGLRELAAITTATQCAVAPLLLFQMGTLSMVAVPANLLVLVAVPPAMLTSFLAAVATWVAAPLATLLASLAFGLLSYIIFVVELLSRVPGASLSVPPFPFLLVPLAYGGLWWIWKRYHPRGGAGGALVHRGEV